ncbi:FAD-dependent oxidoreductase [Anabaena subtropica]|uniref:FAD-dependent monooxygenase n=1 Tax=Anabaena subtropica FACHB-260 TaxID=2692884 RepID=A0ABR8CLL0_9NOST|nr:NAD(P)/FAD-dependent oxidoreductase [Anabaena subtropica]MBD2343774.1 FAD-dependent monooxygenase [Anabaena subtropica FACHB-260]
MPEHKSTHDLTTNNSALTPSDFLTSYDVLVVGAGPVGLATAIGLRKRGIEKILVLDQTRAFRQVGQGLDLLPNGLQSLRYLDYDAYEAVKKASITFSNSQPANQAQKPPDTLQKWHYRNLQGEIIRSISLSFDDWFQDYGEGRVSISWYNLQTALRNLLPQDQVKVNHRCINITDEPENGCVRIDCVSDTTLEANPYAYWNDPNSEKSEADSPQSISKSFRAKIIVAADGINSTIRQVLYKDSHNQNFAIPEYSGFVAISCRAIVDIPKEVQTELEEKFLHGSPIVTICHNEMSRTAVGDTQDTRILLFSRVSGQFGYVIHLPVALESIQNKSGSSWIELALQTFEQAEFPHALKELVRLSPLENMEQRPYYVHRVTSTNESPQIQPNWSAGRVVLVGDAAHGMPPFMAQGANQGLEDALIVATLIAKIAKDNHWQDRQAIETAFQKYESLRRPLMAYVQQATLRRLPYSSDKDWEEYGQQLYRRNFDQTLESLFIK